MLESSPTNTRNYILSASVPDTIEMTTQRREATCSHLDMADDSAIESYVVDQEHHEWCTICGLIWVVPAKA
jgi:hypothetical protein